MAHPTSTVVILSLMATLLIFCSAEAQSPTKLPRPSRPPTAAPTSPSAKAPVTASSPTMANSPPSASPDSDLTPTSISFPPSENDAVSKRLASRKGALAVGVLAVAMVVVM
ncbi:hypothetical protein FNV43_RR22140 [Rhamnella rubrinervis]|uniref:Uncharacterized protein n=1 Tax=Rhamnella rubrinervis TaxID=2594499 RepID=A0A8K0DTQ6_9ROSA|nr:hypothetical protein FNV43_RR22140 [Rhamnella rubrinervis]